MSTALSEIELILTDHANAAADRKADECAVNLGKWLNAPLDEWRQARECAKDIRFTMEMAALALTRKTENARSSAELSQMTLYELRNFLMSAARDVRDARIEGRKA